MNQITNEIEGRIAGADTIGVLSEVTTSRGIDVERCALFTMLGGDANDPKAVSGKTTVRALRQFSSSYSYRSFTPNFPSVIWFFPLNHPH